MVSVPAEIEPTISERKKSKRKAELEVQCAEIPEEVNVDQNSKSLQKDDKKKKSQKEKEASTGAEPHDTARHALPRSDAFCDPADEKKATKKAKVLAKNELDSETPHTEVIDISHREKKSTGSASSFAVEGKVDLAGNPDYDMASMANFVAVDIGVITEKPNKKRKVKEPIAIKSGVPDIQIQPDVTKNNRNKNKNLEIVEQKINAVQECQAMPDGSVVVTEGKKSVAALTETTDNGEQLTTTTSATSYTRVNYSLSMRGIRAKLQKMSDQEKSLMFPGSNLFEIKGYADHHFFGENSA